MKYRHFKTKNKFLEVFNEGNIISNDDVCFIKDTGEIWTHGEFYAKTEDLENRVYSLEPESGKYFTIVSLSNNNTIGWKAFSANLIKTISISEDGGTTWTTKESSTSGTTLATLNNGDKLLIKGSNTAYGNNNYYNFFTSTGNFNVEGNIMSLIYGDNFIGQDTLDSGGYNLKYLFYQCNKLISAENLVLPATALAVSCYSRMFWGCTGLTEAPILPATTLANSCYSNMFLGCTSLTEAPELPATTLAQYCYSNMFNGCTSLTKAPELPATTLTQGCYEFMFYDCTSLTKAPELPATTLAQDCYQYMFSGCTSLTKTPELPADTLARGCYYGMFRGCTSLTEAPVLPATTLSDLCYSGMFEGCTSLITAPELPATTLADSCYQYMFYDCTSLNYIKCLATDISANSCTNSWVGIAQGGCGCGCGSGSGSESISTLGTFIKADSMTSWTTGTSGIPTNWTVRNASDVEPVLGEDLKLDENYTESSLSNAALTIAPGDSYQTAISKIHKAILDDEYVSASAISDIYDKMALKEDLVDINSEIEILQNSETLLSTDINRLKDNIYYMGEFSSSEDAENAAKSANLAGNKEKIILYYDVTSGNYQGTGYIYQYQGGSTATIQYQYWYGNKFYRTITFTDSTKTTVATNGVTEWLQLGNISLSEQNYIIGLTELYSTPTDLKGVIDSKADKEHTHPELEDYSKQYLTFEALENGTFSFSTNALQYSIDGGETWTTLESNTASPEVSAGSKIMWKQTGLTPDVTNGIGTFSATGNFKAYGNVMSLYYGDNFVGQTDLSGKNFAFCGLFRNNTYLTNAEDLILPAIILSRDCYKSMFQGCSSLTKAPELPAITLADGCYMYMFFGCTALGNIKCFATDISAVSCVTNWVYGVAESGTFTKNVSMFSWKTGINGIPSGWTVSEDKEKVVHKYEISDIFNIKEYNNNLYYRKPGNKYYPISNPDLSTQPSLLPSRLGVYNVYEVLMPIYGGQNIVEGAKASDQYIVTYSNDTEKYLTFLSGEIIFNNSVILDAQLIGNNVYSSVSVLKEGDAYKVYPVVPIDFFSDTIDFLYLKYFNEKGGYYYSYTNKIDYSKQYLTFEALEETTFTFSQNSLQYSLDEGLTWDTLASDTASPILMAGDKIMWKQTGLTPQEFSGIGTFSATGNFKASGNVMSLYYEDNFVGQKSLSGKNYAFCRLFSGNTHLTDAKDLVLPATTLGQYCYGQMFYNCTSLTEAPELPATTLANSCYYRMFQNCSSLTEVPELPATTLALYCCSYMFRDCTSLTKAPVLPATTLATACYYQMFTGCTSLTEAPVLPATTLAQDCYREMFYGCSRLNSIICLATDISATNCTYDWVQNVSAIGTFIGADSTSWTTGNSGIPEGWTSYTVSEYNSLCLTFEAVEDTSFTFSGSSLWYSLDGGSTWDTLEANMASPVVSAGSKIKWKQTGLTPSSLYGIGTFSATGNFKASGNVMSLYYGENLMGQKSLEGKDYAFLGLFMNNTHLIDAKDLILPATILALYCYREMFNCCTALTEAPVLPATTLANGCYSSMFRDCTSLTEAPVLPATTLANYCYEFMFSGCTSLTEAPVLPATTLAQYCYYSMFRDCTSLTEAPELPATTLAESCYYRMFQNCTALTEAPVLPATTLANGCYSSMFRDCTSLTEAPVLPATTLANYCYEFMFSGCTSLTEAPVLPATTLALECYYSMFRDCTSLTEAPVLLATTLANYCYKFMFYGCTSLTEAPVLPATTLSTGCYYGMFQGCTSLTKTPELPVITLAQECYREMFRSCTSLMKTPELPATTLADWCYYGMFNGCTSLTEAPVLPATTLANSCYEFMFYGCTSLTEAPVLPATTLVPNCYREMFRSCSRLKYIKCLATDISADSCTTSWVSGVSGTGTFIADSISWTTGTSGIPSGWTVQNAS